MLQLYLLVYLERMFYALYNKQVSNIIDEIG